jgi:hypothetical protein
VKENQPFLTGIHQDSIAQEHLKKICELVTLKSDLMTYQRLKDQLNSLSPETIYQKEKAQEAKVEQHLLFLKENLSHTLLKLERSATIQIRILALSLTIRRLTYGEIVDFIISYKILINWLYFGSANRLIGGAVYSHAKDLQSSGICLDTDDLRSIGVEEALAICWIFKKPSLYALISKYLGTRVSDRIGKIMKAYYRSTRLERENLLQSGSFSDQ